MAPYSIPKVPLAHRTCFLPQPVIRSKPRKLKAFEYEWVERIEEDSALEYSGGENEYDGDWD
jgi:hypothetical protein